MARDILIISGSVSRRPGSRALLERAGYEVRETISIDNALAVAKRARPLAVVIEAPADPDAPTRFARRLRRHPVTKDVPVLVMTSDPIVASPPALPAVSWIPDTASPRRLLQEIAYLTRPTSRSASSETSPER